MEHVEEMYADVGGYPTGFGGISFPGVLVPLAPGGDVGQIHIEDSVGLILSDFVSQSDDGWMKSELQYREHPSRRILLDLLKCVYVPRIQDQGFLADGACPRTEGEADVGVVQVVGGTDGHKIDFPFAFAPTELLDMPVESLEIDEEIGVGEIGVDDADGVVGIHGRNEPVAGVLDGLQVAGGYKTSYAYNGEIE